MYSTTARERIVKGKGDILVTFRNDEEMFMPNVLYLLDLKTNILLGKLDDQGCRTLLSSRFLMIHDKFGRLLTKTRQTKGNMY